MKHGIPAELVECLVKEQFPRWAGLPVTPVELDGWDNTTFRLGDRLSVRLPSAGAYVAQVEKEHRWLPVLAPRLPRPIPEPLAMGVPGCGFPRPWSVYRWLEGDLATIDRIVDLPGFAADLAAFLVALYAVDTAGGPVAGAHSFFRGAPPTTLDEDVRSAIAELAGGIDADAATGAWEAALDAAWCGPDVWVHGDITGSNLLAIDGRLSAVLDFGCCAVGDPACDLAVAWTLFHGDSRCVFRERLGLDEGTWARGRGWALWKALITLAEPSRSAQAEQDRAGTRFGWRVGARGVIDEVLAEFASTERAPPFP